MCLLSVGEEIVGRNVLVLFLHKEWDQIDQIDHSWKQVVISLRSDLNTVVNNDEM